MRQNKSNLESKFLPSWRAVELFFMVGTSIWPNKVGLNLARHTMVICSMSGPVGGTNLLGYVQTSQSIGGVWHYSVALSPVTSLRSNWVLVENMNPSQLIPFGMVRVRFRVRV